MVDARVSVSLGLIVTELVINALKHAFPDGRPGAVTVDYNFDGPNWVLSVRDDGVGVPLTAPVRTGLGTGIVQALAKQLKATVEILPRQPGTMVTIRRAEITRGAEPLAAPPGLSPSNVSRQPRSAAEEPG